MLSFLLLASLDAVDPQNLQALASIVLEKVQSRDWLGLAAIAVVCITWAIRRYGAKYLPFLGTPYGGALSAFVVAALGGVGNTLATGAVPDKSTLVSILSVAFTAAGGWSIFKSLALELVWARVKAFFAPPPAPPALQSVPAGVAPPPDAPAEEPTI